MQQFNEPVRYQPPPLQPLKTGMPLILKLFLGSCGCAFLLGLVAILWFTSWLRSPEVTEFIEMMPVDEQHVGEKLAWRTLVEFPNRLGFSIWTVAGNFDPDQGQELVVIAPGTSSWVIKLTGQMYEITGPQPHSLNKMLAWDADGDGFDELVFEEFGEPPAVVATGVDGTVKRRFENRGFHSLSITGDYNGNGKLELLLVEMEKENAWLYTHDGQEARVSHPSDRGFPLFMADVDGDGLAEVITYDYKAYSIYNYHGDTQTEFWNTFPEYTRPFWALDITGDGINDFVCPTLGFVDPTDTLIPFRYLKKPDGRYLLDQAVYSCAIFQASQDSPRQVVIAPTDQFSGHIYMFDKTGALTYHEQMRAQPAGLHVLKKDGQEFLVVVTGEKILVYP